MAVCPLGNTHGVGVCASVIVYDLSQEAKK